MPLISYIIPYFNLPIEMLRECIDSILDASLDDGEREIIVVDDGSERSIEGKLKDYGNRITYHRKQNGGLSSARNAGLEIAKGEYIQFVDGDDKLNTQAYEYCLKLLKRAKGDLIVFDFCRKKESFAEAITAGPIDGATYLLNNNIRASACGYIARREIIGSLRFTDGILHEDEEFTPQLFLRAKEVYITNIKAYIYTIRSGSIMTTRSEEHLNKRLNDRKSILLKLQSLVKTLPNTSQEALQRRVAQLTMDDIYNVIVDSGSLMKTQKRLEELQKEGLFPLPNRNYTTKYKWFRRLTNTQLGLRLLVFTLPLLSRER